MKDYLTDSAAFLERRTDGYAIAIWDAEDAVLTVATSGAGEASPQPMAWRLSLRTLPTEDDARSAARLIGQPAFAKHLSPAHSRVCLDLEGTVEALDRASIHSPRETARFREALDPDALATAASCGMSWLCFGHLRGDDETSRWLRETYARHPWLVASYRPERLKKAFAPDRVERKWVDGPPLLPSPDATVLALIGKGRKKATARTGPTLDASRLDLDEWPVTLPAVRAMAGFRVAAAHSSGDATVTRLMLQAMSAVPPSWLPKTMSEEDAEIFGILGRLVNSDVAPGRRGLENLLKGTRGDLAGMAASLSRGHRSTVSGFRNRIHELSDYCLRFTRDFSWLVAGDRLIRGAGWPDMHAFLIGGRTLPALCEASDRWHRHERRIRLSVDGLRGGSWPAVTPPFTASNGLTVTALTTAVDLDAEGKDGPDFDGIDGLDHCVGGHAGECEAGACHVLSVRKPHPGGFERLSTISAVVESDGNLRIEEHQGPSNTPPTPAALTAAAEWLEAVSTGVLETDPEAMTARDPGRTAQDRAWDAEASFLRRDSALEAWQPLLRQGLRGMDADEIDAAFRQRMADEGFVIVPAVTRIPDLTGAHGHPGHTHASHHASP